MTTEQNKPLFVTCGVLPHAGFYDKECCVTVGDVIKTVYGPGYTGFYRIVEIDGVLSIKNHFMFGDVGISHFIKQGGQVVKVSPKDVYLFCKKNNWNTEKYLMLFK